MLNVLQIKINVLHLHQDNQRILIMSRISRQKNGLEPTEITSVRVEESVKIKCQQLHGSLAKALRFAAENPPKTKKP